MEDFGSYLFYTKLLKIQNFSTSLHNADVLKLPYKSSLARNNIENDSSARNDIKIFYSDFHFCFRSRGKFMRPELKCYSKKSKHRVVFER